VKKNEESSFTFEVLAGCFFLFFSLASIWEVFMLVIDPIYFQMQFYNSQLFPSINVFGFSLFARFTGELSVYCILFIGLGLLSIGIERGSKIKSKGALSIIPFSFTVAALIFGDLIITVPWLYLTLTIIFALLIVPILFFYVAIKSTGTLRRKSTIIALGYFIIFGGEALDTNMINKLFPAWVPYLENLIKIPISWLMPLIAITGCILLFIGLNRFD